MTDKPKDLKWIKKQLGDLAWNEKKNLRNKKYSKKKTEESDLLKDEAEVDEIFNKIIEEERLAKELKKIEKAKRAQKVIKKRSPKSPKKAKIPSFKPAGKKKKIEVIEVIEKRIEEEPAVFTISEPKKYEIKILAPNLIELIKKDISRLEKINFKFKSTAKEEDINVCYRCGNECDSGFKSVVETKDGIKKVKFCSIECFEDTNNKKHWVKVK